MNRREKLLAGLVACLAVMMVAYLVWGSVQTALARRNATLTNLRKQVQEQERTLRKASAATRKLAELQKRSLPTDRERANSLYQQWLLNLVDRLGFIDPSVQVADRRTRGGFYSQGRFEDRRRSDTGSTDRLSHRLLLIRRSASDSAAID